MKRADRTRWKQARSLADVGEITVAWLHGELRETPSHMAPPDPETLPHIPVLTLVNRAGFVTENSQSASDETDAGQWNAWVCGFADESALARLAAAVDGTPLVIETRCRGREHHGHRGGWWRCPRRDLNGYYADRCPGAADEITAAWFVMVADPEPGRNDRLWPALERFAASG